MELVDYKKICEVRYNTVSQQTFLIVQLLHITAGDTRDESSWYDGGSVTRICSDYGGCIRRNKSTSYILTFVGTGSVQFIT